MGIIKILCLFCLCSVPECFVYWEDLNNDEKAKITNSQTLPPIVKSYYNGEAHLTDDDNTFEYLNVLSEPKNAEQKMLYLYLLNSTEPAITGTNVKITELAPCRRHEDGALWI